MKLFDDPSQEHIVWRVRESGLGATARVPGERDSWEGWEDSAVPPERLGRYLRDLRALFDRYGYRGALYGHYGQGCVHTRIDFDLVTAEGIARFRAFIHDAADLVVRHGGSLSGEHGDGQSRAELLPKMFGAELVEAFAEFKAIWDPDAKMNPGKLVRPYRADENLRLGTSYKPKPLATHFQYPGDDKGQFARGVLRCVGVGECRRAHQGTMCPSYMVTGEEMHSTRGRARLLFEMLRGDVIETGWRSKEVHEALDLCLSCKGCKSDCPVNVDMATYKAEFLSHYYAWRIRPRHAFAFGLIGRWARLGGLAPRVANFFTQAPLIRTATKWASGVAPARTLPAFARTPFTSWFARRDSPGKNGRRVILWPDTFNNYFRPETARAAVNVLERSGYVVSVPSAWVCCGRPLYDYGMLDTAKRWLRRVLDVMEEEIAAGTPIVGLEPSCVAVFRDELINLFPNDSRAARLSAQCVHLSELLARQSDALPFRPLRRPVLLHGHCHHKAIMKLDAECAVLERLGLDVQALDAGCCGMAGAFGFERAHYDISIKCGERVLLPAVRNATPETLIVADGFSCREQIAQTTGRRAMHLAEVLDLALGDGAIS